MTEERKQIAGHVLACGTQIMGLGASAMGFLLTSLVAKLGITTNDKKL